MIPREGQKWTVRRGKRDVVVVIVGIYRRPPLRHPKFWHEIFYRTEGTHAAHGKRNATVRSFLKFAKPKEPTP